MDIGTVGMWFVLDAMTAPESIEFAQKIEKLGYNTLWIPEGFGREPFAHAAQLLAHTKRLIIATGIANIWARDPMTMAAAANTVAEGSGGRFILGIGVSHKPIVNDLRGHNYKPYSYMKEYLPKMKNALYMAPKPKEPVPIVVAALHPKMIELAATQANGTHPYFVQPEHTAKVRAAIGPEPMICVEQAIILSTDAAKARARARSYMKTYIPGLPNYVNNLKNLGWADAEFENGCSDRLVDAIVARGSEKQIQDRIEAHLKAGATQVCIQPLHPDNDKHPDLKAVEAFAELNKPLRIDPRALRPNLVSEIGSRSRLLSLDSRIDKPSVSGPETN